MTNPKRRYSGNDVGHMAEQCDANMRLKAENKRLLEIFAKLEAEKELLQTQVNCVGIVNKRLREALQRLIDTADGWVEPSAIDDARKAVEGE